MNACKWEIIYVPPNPPFVSTQQPTADVFASVIDPKMANTLVRKLNQIAPLETFRHVKRVRKSSLGGGTELSVILCLAGDFDSELRSMPGDVLELIDRYQLSPFITQVCKYAATTKEEWEEQCKLWPTSFHPPTYNIEGINGFDEDGSKCVFNYMSFALELAKSGSSQLRNAAVIVDPSVDLIIASACDEMSSMPIVPDINGVQLLEADEQSTSHGVANGSSSFTLNLNGSPDESKTMHMGVSCLNPWQWSQQHKQSSGYCFWHPLRHAAMVSIEHSAARDMRLFPTAEKIDGKPVQDVLMENSVGGTPVKRQRSPISMRSSEEASTNDFPSKSDRPYLCTGYDVYLAWEPCPMCAMALLHQRVRRIFYAFPNPNTGALGSVYRLQGEKSLNHHYAVFRVVLHGEPLGNTTI